MELIKRKTAYFFDCHAEINDDKFIIPENYLELEEDITIAIEALYKEGYNTFLLGRSSYFEVLTATIIKKFIENHTDVRLFCLMPPSSCKEYPTLKTMLFSERSDDENLLEYNSKQEEIKCYNLRNDFIAGNSSIAVCYFGGMIMCEAFYCYSKKLGIDLKYISIDKNF